MNKHKKREEVEREEREAGERGYLDKERIEITSCRNSSVGRALD